MHKVFESYIKKGLIKKQSHPTEPLWIYNYTHKTQVEDAWDTVTRQARGIILNEEGNVVARPFKKFFNLSENKTNVPATEPKVYEKLDGSLGILYWVNNKPFIATRGSFTSDQAIKGTELLQKYKEHFHRLNRAYTYLFEIIYPENRIVVDYNGMEDLIFLGAVHNESGEEFAPDDSVLKHTVFKIAEPLTKKEVETQRKNKEGVVLFWPAEQVKVKVKYDEYIRLHRILTDVTELRIWDLLRNKHSTKELIYNMPEEFSKWVKETIKELHNKYDRIENKATSLCELFKDMERKEIAQRLRRHKDISSIVFSMLDGKNYSDAIWKKIKPKNI